VALHKASIIAISVLVVQNTVKRGRDKAGRKYHYFWLYHIAYYMSKYLVSRNKLVLTRTEPTSTNLRRKKPQVPGDAKYNICENQSLSLIAYELVRIIELGFSLICAEIIEIWANWLWESKNAQNSIFSIRTFGTAISCKVVP
jgi:hypothetical protein